MKLCSQKPSHTALFFVVVIICGIVYKVKHKMQRRNGLPKVVPESQVTRSGGKKKQKKMTPVGIEAKNPSVLENALFI